MIRPPSRAFEYLLNAMVRAAHESEPVKHGYADKRKAVLAYVAHLESLAEARGRAVDAARDYVKLCRGEGLGYMSVGEVDIAARFSTMEAALAAIPKE